MSKTDNKIVCRVAQEIEHLSMNLLWDNLSWLKLIQSGARINDYNIIRIIILNISK